MKVNSKVAMYLGAAALMTASGSASADVDVSFYGLLDVWAGSQETPGADDDTKQLGAGGMTTSYIGTTATIDLPNETKAIAKLEMFLRPDNAEDGRYGGDEMFARAASVGFQGKLGTLSAGRVTAPLFLPVVFSNPYGGSFTFSPAILHTYQGGNNGPYVGDSGWSDSLSYSSPSLGGLSANLVYSFGEEEGEDSENKVGANLVYRNGGFMGTVAGHSVDEGALDSGDSAGFGEGGAIPNAIGQDAYMAGVSYDFSVVKLFGMYQDLETETQTGDVDIDTVQAGFSIPAGPGSVLGSYAVSDYSGEIDDERTTWTVGYDWVLNDNVDIYANFMNDDFDELGDGNTYGVGTRLKF